MELKVWVEGIQRVVCGVTDASTCQDVVYALAHATGQTGRFTLVEKWRNSERLLAPHEQPLKVLMKWGEYANDVHFLMRKSLSECSNKGQQQHQQSNNQFPQSHKRQHDFLHNFSPTGSNLNQKISLNNKEIKKSLTFSCGHGSSGSVSSENSTPSMSNNNTPSKMETSSSSEPTNTNSLKNRDAKSRQDLPKGVVRGIPQKPRESENANSGFARTERPKHPPPYDEAVSRSSGRFAPSHLSLASPTSPSTDEVSPSTKRRHLAVKNDQVCDLSQTKSPPVQQTTKDSNGSENSMRGTITNKDKSTNKSSDKAITSHQKGGHIEDVHSTKSKKSVVSRFENDKHISNDIKHSMIPVKTGSTLEDSPNRDPQYQDLQRLVSLQREKLDNQQSEMTQFDAEIVCWEGRLQEQEEKLRVLQDEMTRLDRTHHDQDNELVELDRRSFSEEVDLGRQEERTLRSELTLSRSQLANCETELLQCHQRIRLLLEEITEERRIKVVQDEKEKAELQEQERQLQEQLETLQQQLKQKSSESDSQKTATDKVRDELNEMESKISDKQKEVQNLISEIREANLCSLSLIPTEEGKLITEGSFCNRPGSTRKIIGSPRQLENAVPTNKNPHGVWV